MATTIAWTTIYRTALDRLGLDVTTHDDHLRVATGAGWVFHLSTDPDERPHYLQIAFPVSYSSHNELLSGRHDLMATLATHLTAETDTVKAIATGPTRCLYLIQTHLAPPGSLPHPDLLTALLPTYLSLLTAAHHDLVTELEAATLYTT